MTVNFKKTGRKLFALALTIILYYVIHEGAHLIYALFTNSFERINFLFPGVQIQINIANLTNTQIGILNILGASATLSVAYILCLSSKKITSIKSNLARAVFYYVTIMFLLNDPIYLSLLCDLFGGGDMNGIALIIPEAAARIIFGLIGVINLVIIFKYVTPQYKKAFLYHNNI